MVFGRAEGDFAASYDLKSPDVVDGKTATSFLGLRAENALGIGVGSAGDLNGDGVADVWVRKAKKHASRHVKHRCDSASRCSQHFDRSGCVIIMCRQSSGGLFTPTQLNSRRCLVLWWTSKKQREALPCAPNKNGQRVVSLPAARQSEILMALRGATKDIARWHVDYGWVGEASEIVSTVR